MSLVQPVSIDGHPVVAEAVVVGQPMAVPGIGIISLDTVLLGDEDWLCEQIQRDQI